jgi:transcriptional regulator with XRE-family HTH domain
MSNFGAKLSELLERKKLSQAEISRVTGLSEALISKWTNGQQKFVSNDDLAKLCAYISTNPKEQAELIRAHLYDEMPAPGSELIDIRIKGLGSYFKDAAPSYRTALPLNLQRALDILGQEALTDSDVRAVILGLAGIVTPDVSSLHEHMPSTAANAPVKLPGFEEVHQNAAEKKTLQPLDDKADPPLPSAPRQKSKGHRPAKTK